MSPRLLHMLLGRGFGGRRRGHVRCCGWSGVVQSGQVSMGLKGLEINGVIKLGRVIHDLVVETQDDATHICGVQSEVTNQVHSGHHKPTCKLPRERCANSKLQCKHSDPQPTSIGILLNAIIPPLAGPMKP